MRWVREVKHPRASLVSQILLYLFVICDWLHLQLLACSNKVGATVLPQLPCWTLNSEESAKSIYKAGAIHQLYYFDMYGPCANTCELNGPAFSVCQSPSGLTRVTTKRHKKIQPYKGEWRVHTESQEVSRTSSELKSFLAVCDTEHTERLYYWCAFFQLWSRSQPLLEHPLWRCVPDVQHSCNNVEWEELWCDCDQGRAEDTLNFYQSLLVKGIHQSWVS